MVGEVEAKLDLRMSLLILTLISANLQGLDSIFRVFQVLFCNILLHNRTIRHNHLSLAIAENSDTEYESEAEEIETNAESLDIATNNDNESDNLDQNDLNSDISEG